MSGPLHIGELIQDALDSQSCTLVSSDGNEGTLASNNLIAELQDQGMDVQTSAPQTTCNAFNAQVCDVQQPAVSEPSGPQEPRPDLNKDANSDMNFG